MTSWNGKYGLQLLEDFGYVDPEGRIWLASKGTHLNGASIPRPLWGRVGSPFISPFHKASIIHNNYVGTTPSPFCDIEKRRNADRMFYAASKLCGCSQRLSGILYICASISTWTCLHFKVFAPYFDKALDDISWTKEEQTIMNIFDDITEQLESELAEMDFRTLEVYITKKLFPIEQ